MKLSEAGVILLDCDHKTPEAVEAGRPYIGIPQMTSGRIDFSSARQISEADFVTWNRKTKYQRHDVVLSRRTNPGVTAIDETGTEFALGQNLVLLRADGKRVDPPILRWLVRTPEWWEQIEKFMNVGAVFSSLRCRDVPSFELTIPPLPEQRAIAATLGALDDKIELNRKMNATLEAMARALFRDWFVDFGPTRAKMEGRAPYLSPDLWSLFPDHLDDEGKPEGWEVRPIRENCIRVTNGGTPKRDVPEYWNDGHIPWLSSGEVRQKLILATASHITHRGMRESSAKLVASGSSVVALYGATAGQVSYLAAEVTTNQAVCALTPKPGFRAFNFLKLSSETETLLGMATGSAQQNLSKTLVENFPALTAPQRTMDAFEATVALWLEKMVHNEHESRTLAQTRDLLLPRLMSGELRAAEASETLEAVL